VILNEQQQIITMVKKLGTIQAVKQPLMDRALVEAKANNNNNHHGELSTKISQRKALIL
jgi:hypothetical protein